MAQLKRTEEITRKIVEQLMKRNIEDDSDLLGIRIEVRLRPGGGRPRSVRVGLDYEEETT